MAYLTPKQRRENGGTTQLPSYITPRKRRSKIEDETEAVRRSKMGTTKNMTADTITTVAPPKTKEPTLLQKTGSVLKSVITDPLGSVTKGAGKIDEALAKSDNIFSRNIDAGLGDISSATLNSIPGGYDSQSGPALQIKDDSAKSQARGDDTIPGHVIRAIPRAVGAIGATYASGGLGLGKALPFLYSLGQTYGGAYGQGRDAGASHEQARNAALIQAIPQAAIEMSGGIENAPANAAGQGLLRTIGRAAGEEALEEVMQYPFEGLAKKLTYAPGTPIFSTKENAIINPVEMGQGAVVGGIAGGLMGGGAKAISGLGNIRRPSFDTPIKPEIKPSTPANLKADSQVIAPGVQQQSVPAPEPMQRTSLDAAPTADFAPIGGTAETPQGRIYSETPKGDIPNGMKERGFSQNVRTDQAMPDDIRTSFDENPLVYDPDTNPETLSRAQDIFNKGETEAISELYKGLNEGIPKPEMAPLAKLLAKQASEQGDTTKARVILSDLADKLTSSGKFSQASKVLRDADPETFLMTMDKQLKKLNEQGKKQYGKKWNDIDLTQGEIDAINQIERGNQQSYDDTWGKIGDRIAKELPSTGMEKFDAWRRIAMLLNPKTHIRNVSGNVMMMGMRKTSDTLGAALEKVFVPEGQRTKSVGWSLNKDVVSKVNNNWDTVKKDILGESRWEIDNLKSLGMEKDIFETKWLQKLNRASLDSLNWEDNIFTERAYKDALGQYLQANNMGAVTDEAVAYAKRRALEATFKQANKLATWLNEAKRAPVVGKLVEGAIPFTKTPANIMMRGFEYSPGGLIKFLYDVGAKKSAATAIEDLAKGLTGSAIAALGFWLASMGWAKVERKRSDKAEALMQEMGDQTNSIITPLGSYTFDWAQPFSMPLAIGIAAQEATRNMEDGAEVTQAVIDGIAAGGDTLFNMSMLQNIRRILGSYGSPTEKIMGIPISYVQQAIPSILGQTARTVDPVRRSTYDPNAGQQLLNTVKAKIPGLSQSLEPMLNIWGEEQQQGGVIQQFINPGYYKAPSNDPVTMEVVRLYNSVKDTDILPKVVQNKIGNYTLTAEQKTEFQRQMGRENYIDMQAVIHTDRYQSATDDNRAKILKKITKRNYDDAKKAIINGATQ